MTSGSVTLGDAGYSGQDVSGVKLLWTDPPYGTGKTQQRGNNAYHDASDVSGTIERIQSWLPNLDDDATVVVCCDYRLAPHLCVELDWCYRGEIIWEFGLGRPRTSWWPVRHNNLLTFTKTESSGKFNALAVPRVKRLAPKPGYPDDKPAGSVWDFTFNNTHPDRRGYPNQKPLEIIVPFILVHTDPGDTVLDIYCGSGSTGVAAVRNGRHFIGIDNNPEAIAIAETALAAR